MPEPHVLLARRALLMFRISAAMYLVGAANVLVAALIADLPTGAVQSRLINAAALTVIGTALLAVRPTPRVTGALTLFGVSAISWVMVTNLPLGAGPLFYVWPVALAAYFVSPRMVAAVIGWTILNVIVAINLVEVDVDQLGLVVGLLLNLSLLGAFIAGLRWREERLADGLERAASIDPLTGLLTRRGFLPIVEGWLSDEKMRPAFVLIDVDHFKRFNDRHGHLAGDEALRVAAGALRAALPDGGLLCRFGGEEFAVALPEGGLEAARAFCERAATELRAGPNGLTISAGVAVRSQTEAHVEELVARSDDALYLSKETGRNRAAWWPADAADVVAAHEPVVGGSFGGPAQAPGLGVAA